MSDLQPNPGLSPSSPSQATSAALEIPERNDVSLLYNGIRSWTIWSLLIGGTSIIASSVFDPVWGVLLIVVAILSWKIKIPAMFIIYTIAMGWVAVENAMSVLGGGDTWWLTLAIVQAVLTITIAKQFRKYRNLQLQEIYQTGAWPAHIPPPQDEAVVLNRFAIAGVILAGASLILLPSICAGSFAWEFISPSSTPWQLFYIVLNSTVDIAVLALGLSCAARFAGNNKRGFTLGGIVMSALVLIAWLGFDIIAILTQ